MNKLTRTLLAAGLMFGLAGGAMAAEGHSHGGGHAAALKLNDGKKWQTDEPARKGMTDIRNALAGSLDAIHHGKMTPDGYKALAGKLEGSIHYMVENCKLAPEVDEQLHIVLEQVFEGVDAMKGGQHAMDGAVKVVMALDAYGKHFDHPGWKPIAH